VAIVGFLHISLRVSDLDRSCRFYQEVLACEVGRVRLLESPAASGPVLREGARGRAADVSRDGLEIELIELDASRPAAASAAADADPGPVHLVFAVDDLESTLQSARDRGAVVIEESRICLARGVASCFVRDPDGLPIQLYQQPAGVSRP
jgi:catechol 2,3-dioxygenase-like lactoylglutathione lyase family enzyme